MSSKMAALVLPPLAFVASSFIFRNIPQIRLYAQQDCAIPGAQLALPYTGVESIDRRLCPFVSIFQSVLDETFLTYFLLAMGPVIGLISFEAERRNVSRWIRYPVLVGLGIQVFSFGVMMPVYCLLFLLSNSTKDRKSRTISKHQTIGVLASFALGCILPTILLVYLKNPYTTALWQIFPVGMGLVGLLYRTVSSSAAGKESGEGILKGYYILSIIFSSLAHISFVYPILISSPSKVLSFFLTQTSPSSTLRVLSLDLLQYDYIFGVSGLVLSTLFLARSPAQLGLMVAWYIIGGVLIGPGAAFLVVCYLAEN